MLNAENSVLTVVDVQGKLAQMMHEKERFFQNLAVMIQGAKILEIPILWLEQMPENLGSTTAEIAALLDGLQPIPKHSFSAWGEPVFREAFRKTKRKKILLTGIETHICVYQTARDLLLQGCEVHVISDAVASRIAENRSIGLERIKDAGGVRSSVETALFEIMKEAGGEKFREIVRMLR
ncbi:MAG: isochorismatase family protein [Desulfococcaceae bacterium]|jgi:nicotinamidase-related amidase|nr:isochorismatase family protein [Desulfococcaceae bacterium]